MPLFRCFQLEILEQAFAKHGIFLFEKFPDGQTRWANQPKPEEGSKFKGKSCMANRYEPFSTNTGKDYYDIFVIRGIIARLGKSDDSKEIEAEIEEMDLEASEREN
jgi:hypothetical protein